MPWPRKAVENRHESYGCTSSGDIVRSFSASITIPWGAFARRILFPLDSPRSLAGQALRRRRPHAQASFGFRRFSERREQFAPRCRCRPQGLPGLGRAGHDEKEMRGPSRDEIIQRHFTRRARSRPALTSPLDSKVGAEFELNQPRFPGELIISDSAGKMAASEEPARLPSACKPRVEVRTHTPEWGSL